MREPELPRAWPKEMAPPTGLTLAFSRPRIYMGKINGLDSSR